MKHAILKSLSSICLLLLICGQATGQIRANASYLKIMPGARSQGLAESLTGTIDNMYAIYANPGATGLLREWQWSVAYTNWIPDIYNASFFFGKQVGFPWSRHSRIALGISYLGIKDFDSSKGRAPLASGGDLLLTASFGQPLSSINKNLSLGGSIKFLRSRLDNVDAHGFIFDVGLLYRTPRFRLLQTGMGIFDEGILSAGVSITQLGSALHFRNADTPLPRTLRAGMSLNMGTHAGLQVHFTGEYRRSRDEDGYFSVGSELSWAQLLTLRGGYSFEKDNLLRHYAFGLSLGFDDVRARLDGLIPGRNNAMQIEFAKMQSNSWFDAPYRGGISHYPVAPERFEFIEPALGGTVTADSARLSWEASRDPDLYDEVKYWLLVDQDSLQLEHALESFDSRPRDNFFAFLDDAHFILNDTLGQNTFLLRKLVSPLQNLACLEDYYWTVIAFDKDRHQRIVEKTGKRIARFRVALPDLEIRIAEAHFEPDSLAGSHDYKGVACIVVSNAGQATATEVTIAVADSISILWASADPSIVLNPIRLNPIPATIAELRPGARDSITVRWQTSVPDTHRILAWVDKAGIIDECLETNNWAMQRMSLPLIPPTLAFSKTASTDSVQPGDGYSYSLRVENLGLGMARNVKLVDVLPLHVKALDARLSTQDTLTWTIDSLAAHADTTISYRVQVDRVTQLLEGAVTLEGVTFEFNKTRLTREAKTALDDFASVLAQHLKEHPKDSLEIGGHTDSVGPDGYNDTLSKGRAESVRSYLVAKDPVLFSRLTARGHGERQPIAPDIPACQRQNRRVEITIPHRASSIPSMLVNWSQASVAEGKNHQTLVARDTVYVKSAPTSLPSLHGVNFFSGSARLTAEATRILDSAATALRRLMQKDQSVFIEIAGHTDNVGSDDSNLELSKSRADTVRNYFIKKCVSPERLRTFGYGETKPIDVNTTPEGRLRNRRVELRTVTKSST